MGIKADARFAWAQVRSIILNEGVNNFGRMVDAFADGDEATATWHMEALERDARKAAGWKQKARALDAEINSK